MQKTKTILLVALFFNLSCTQSKDESPSDSPMNFSKSTQNLQSYQNTCNELSDLVQSLHNEEGTIKLSSGSDVDKAIAIMDQLPQLSKEHYKLYEDFFEIKEVAKEDVSSLFILISADCWKNTEFKLWGALLSYNENSKDKKEDILRAFKRRVLNTNQYPISSLKLNMELSLLIEASQKGLLDINVESRVALLKIKQEIISEANQLKEQFEKSFAPFINQTVPTKDDIAKARKYLTDEKNFNRSSYEKLKQWVSKNSGK